MMHKPLQIGDAWPFRSVRGLTGAPIEPVWHALITAPQREAKSAGTLTGAGVEVHYPTVTTTRHVRGVKHEYTRPFVSQIIYARFRYAPNWDVLKDRRVITGVFSNGLTPIRLCGDDINRVMGLPTEAERLDAEEAERNRIRPGDKAEVMDGPLGGFFVDVTRTEYGRVWWEHVSGLKGDMAADMLRRICG